MKILQINAVNKIASTGRNCYEISTFFENRRDECVTAYSKGPSVNAEKEFIIGNQWDTKLHGLLSRVSGKQGYFSVGATKRLLAYMDAFSPDIVLLGNLHGNYINIPMLLKYLAEKNIATVAVLHDCWFYTGKCCHYTVDNCYKWQQHCGDCPSLKKYNKSWFFDKTYDVLEDKKKLFGAIPRLAVVGVSDWITNEAKKAPVFKNAKEFVRIYNWIDLESFRQRKDSGLRERLHLENKKIILCVASGWNKEKGLDTVYHLSERLTDNQRLLIVGDMKEDRNWNARVIHIPSTNSAEELAEYYSVADVFIQPSPEETFGKVSAEALACGTPVVCFPTTANPELVGEGCGIVCPTESVEEYYACVQTVLRNGKETYSANCVAFARKNFDKNSNLLQYVQLFENLLQ